MNRVWKPAISDCFGHIGAAEQTVSDTSSLYNVGTHPADTEEH